MTGNGTGAEDRVIDALFAKLETNTFASLTVSEIAAAAGISRKTFYRHFSDKTNVVRRYLEGLMSELVDEDEQMDDMSFAQGIRHYFMYFQDQAPRLRLLRNNGLLDLALPIQNEVFARRFPQLNLPWHEPELGEERLADLFVVGGLWNVLTDSLDANPPIAPTHLAATLMSQVSKRAAKLS
ncbi:TetR/AcrR family transcriptional regulator [Bifidobacterium sp. ESL0790]|uniref:TetR/AcrR family transcriptional regulator n=1 Tax=Bifidobacterium sp. ESL0790 TaxID=2983233 RepID=UPI0023F6C676|nr:TetR/AcrR family transcriptional regulator [Bifidobacterium sp. ESL0790]WEV71720.1 TetR/AcrR family transcriptional regulator [Bifidobacterium sp. ESL0790]